MNNLFFIMYERGFVWNTIRSLFAWLDSVAYTLFSWVMQLIFDIAAVSADPAFNDFYDDIQLRIYALLAIFMLFKITVSMLTYLVDPDSMNDKQQGLGKMSIRVVVSLVMLIAFPMVFQFLNTVQPHILEALPRVILATENFADSNNLTTQGEQIAFDTYNGVFFNMRCADRDVLNVYGEKSCFQYEHTVSSAAEHINDPVEGDDSSYHYSYIPLAGFIVAVVMTLILLGYCVDIAIRVFKLIILQLIAPIPIISYIDPKSSKDGAFSKWIKMVISVWADLFIKLGIIYFVLLVISELITSGTIFEITFNLFGENGIIRGGLVMLALVIGLLFFAKDAPKFIADAMGIKMAENGKLFGGLGKIMAAGALGAGALGSAIASGRASYMADEARGKDHNVGRMFKNVGAGLLGGVTGFGAGASAAVNAKDHNTKAVMDAMAKRNATALSRGSSGSTFFGRTWSAVERTFTGDTAYDKDQREIAALDAKATTGKQLQEFLEDRALKKGSKLRVGSFVFKDDAGASHTVSNVTLDDYLSAWNLAKQRGDQTFTFAGQTLNTFGNAANAIEGDLKVAAGVGWARTATGADKETLDAYTKSFVEAAGSDASAIDVTNSDQVKGIRNAAERESFRKKNSDSYNKHKANAGNGNSSS